MVFGVLYIGVGRIWRLTTGAFYPIQFNMVMNEDGFIPDRLSMEGGVIQECGYSIKQSIQKYVIECKQQFNVGEEKA